jgi:hypothetical protein
MIWAAWVSALVVALSLSFLARDRRAVYSCSLFLLGLLATRPLLWGLPPDWTLTAYGALWVTIGAAVMRAQIAAGALLILSGLCYGWAWHTATPIEPGRLPLILADAAGFAALALICGGAVRGLVGAGDYMGRGRLGRRALSRLRVHPLAQEAASPREVKAP